MSGGISDAIEKNRAREAELAAMMEAKKEKLRQKTEEESRSAWQAEQAKLESQSQEKTKRIYDQIRHEGIKLSDDLKSTRERIALKTQELDELRANLTHQREWKEKVGRKAAKDVETKAADLKEVTETLEAGQKILQESAKELRNLRDIEESQSERLRGFHEESERIQAGQTPSPRIYELLPGLARAEENIKYGAALATEYGSKAEEAQEREAAEEGILELLGNRVGEFIDEGDMSPRAMDAFKDEMLSSVLGDQAVEGLSGAELQALKDNDAWNAIKNAKSNSGRTGIASTLQNRLQKTMQGILNRRKKS